MTRNNNKLGHVVPLPLTDCIRWRLYHERGFAPSDELVDNLRRLILIARKGKELLSTSGMERIERYDLQDLINYGE